VSERDQNAGVEGAGVNGEGEYKEPGKAEANEEEKVDLKKQEQTPPEEETTGIENPGMDTEEGSEAVEYDAGGGKNPMDELADEDNAAEPEEVDTPVDDGPNTDNTESAPEELDKLVDDGEKVLTPEEKPNEAELPPEKEPAPEAAVPAEPPDKFTENPELTESNKPGFDPGTLQDPRMDEKVEGGIARPQTTGPHKTDGDAGKEGQQIKPRKPPEDKGNKFEMAGFTVSFEEKPGQGLVSVEITDYFDDVETAQASVNGDKYLMPLAEGGFKIVTISSGAPKISYQERELYVYLHEKNQWIKS